MNLDDKTNPEYMSLHDWSLEYKTYPDFKVSEQRIKEGVKYYQVKNYDNIFKDKLQRALDKSNLLVDYHGMWDLEDLDSRLNGNWLLFVMEFNEKIIGWNWDAINKISTYENKTGGLAYDVRKKNEFKFIKDIFIPNGWVFGSQFYVDESYRDRKFSPVMLIQHLKLLKELGYENLCWHIEHWNTMGNSLCRYEINIIKKHGDRK